MLKSDYRKLFDSISPDPQLQRQTEKEIMDMLQSKIKRNLRRTICIAAAAVILVLGMAIAAVNASDILERLYPNASPDQSVIDTVVRDSMQTSENGVTLNLDEYLFDRNSIHLSWTVSSERKDPIFYTTSYEFTYDDPDDLSIAEDSIGGSYGAYSSGEIGDGQMVYLDENLRAYSGYAGYAYNMPISSSITAHISIHAYETDYAPANLPDGFSVYDLADADENSEIIFSLEDAKQIGIADGRTNVCGYQVYRDALDRLIESGTNWDEACEAALTESGIFREVAVLEIEMPITPDAAAEPRFSLASACSFELSDATVTLKSFSIDRASTYIEYEVESTKAFDEENILGNGITYILFDQDGNPLNADYALSMSCGQLNDRNGRSVWLVSLQGNPLPESISAVTFVPTCALERREGEATNAFYLRMKQSAETAQCFTIALE